MLAPPIDRFGYYFHIELLKYYYSYLEFYHLDELPLTNYLNFEFPDGTYTIGIQDLIDKAFVEKQNLIEDYELKNDIKLDDEI